MLGVRSYVIQARVQQDKPGAKMPAQHRSVLGVGCVFFFIVAPGGGEGEGVGAIALFGVWGIYLIEI